MNDNTPNAATVAPCLQSFGSVDESIETKVNKLWDALRLECCGTKLRAKRIVLLTKDGVTRAMKRLEDSPPNSSDQQ